MKRMGKSPGFIKLLEEKLLKNYQKNYCSDAFDYAIDNQKGIHYLHM